mgnify:CR=1 FL=1
MLIYYAAVALLGMILAGPAYAQVHVDIGFSLPAPPPLVVVPAVPTVRYVPDAPRNIFFYGGQYWVFHRLRLACEPATRRAVGLRLSAVRSAACPDGASALLPCASGALEAVAAPSAAALGSRVG